MLNIMFCFAGAITTLSFHKTLKVSDFNLFLSVRSLFLGQFKWVTPIMSDLILDCDLASDHTHIFKFHFFCQLMIALIKSKVSVSMFFKEGVLYYTIL